MTNLSKLQWIVVGVVALIVIVVLDVLIGTTVTPRLIATPTPTPTMPANVLFVKLGANGDCRENWVHACDLQTALRNAHPDEEIWVERGGHKPGSERTDTFQLKKGVALYGGFAGKETSRDERNWEENITILSGDIDSNDITANGVITDTANIRGANSYHVVTAASGTDHTAILDGFTITGGQANGAYSGPCGPACGGGMFNNNSSPTLANVAFSGNFAAQAGGGMYNHEYSSPSLTNVTFSGNTARVYGGGMFNGTESNSQLTDVTFSGNTADDSGGGMHNFTSSPVLTATQFLSNTAPLGGGIFNNQNSPTLTNTNFIGNTAKRNGGGMYNTGSSPSLTNVTFSGNRADASGGGMFNDSNSNPTLVNITFAGNSAKDEPDSGGMHNTNSNPTLTNCIVWGNSSPDRSIVNNVDSTATIRNSLVQGSGGSQKWDTRFGVDGGNNIDDDPAFVNPDKGDLHLQRGSPAIDSGDNAAIPADVTTDLDGKPRICNGRVDMGAYEYQTEGCSPK